MRIRAWVPVLAVAIALAMPASAGATTFCVPGFHSACPAGGGRVSIANLETAMQTNGQDGIADTIRIAPGTLTDAETFELDSGDTDDLEIVGAAPGTGAGATRLTSSGSFNGFVVNLNGARQITMSDLTIVVPAAFPDGLGGGLQGDGTDLENVDIESRNLGSDGAPSMVGGGSFRDGRIYGAAGGTVDVGIGTNGAETGTLDIERTVIENASWGVRVDSINVITRVKRTRIVNPVAYGVRVSNGSFAVIENSVIEGVETASSVTEPISVASDSAGTVIVAVRHTTIAGTNISAGEPAISATVHNAVGNGSINLVFTDSIVHGYPDPLWCEAPTSAAIGDATINSSYSWFFHSAIVLGDCSVPTGGTLDSFNPQVGAPQFAGPGDFHLPAGSPAIDSGNPLVVSLPTQDFDGAPRPIDGDGDGDARRDMGAYEYQPPGPEPGPGGDDKAPVLTELKLKRLSAGRGGRVRLTLSEAATVRLIFRAMSAKKGTRATAAARKRVRRFVFKGKAGPNRFRIKAGKLRAGRFRVKVIATDAAGNRSQPLRRRATVRP